MNFNILGITPMQIIFVLLVMLIVAGPKRMVVWAYQLGRYVRQFQKILQEASATFQKELQESGIDLTKDMATLQKEGFNILDEASKVINTEPVTPTPPVAPTTPVPSAAPTAPAAETTPPTNAGPNNADSNQDGKDKPRYDSWLPG